MTNQIHNYHLLLILLGLLAGFITPFQAIGINIVGTKHIIKNGFLSGFIMGLGSSAIQCLFSIIAVLCLYSGAGISPRLDMALVFIGVVLLGYMGYRIYTEKVPNDVNASKNTGAYKSLLLGVTLAIIKPGRIILYAIIFTSFGVHYVASDFLSLYPLVLSLFFGSIMWWLLFGLIINYYKSTILNKLSILNKIGGSLLMLLAIVALISVVF